MFTWIRRYKGNADANATATGVIVSTEQAKVRETADARSTEQAQFEFVDPFDKNIGRWRTASVDDEYMTGTITISDGIYKWNIYKVKQPFVYRREFYQQDSRDLFKDYDVYEDTRINDAASSGACSGLIFRKSTNDWLGNAYVFSVGNDSTLNIYYLEQGDWSPILYGSYSNAIRDNDWNRLDVNVQNNHFAIMINNQIIYEMIADHSSMGGLALYIGVNGSDPVSIWFDNFGCQRY